MKVRTQEVQIPKTLDWVRQNADIVWENDIPILCDHKAMRGVK